MDIDDIVCLNNEIPCDDKTKFSESNRKDGVHYNENHADYIVP
jgi:hypothetical protein